jgi:hypothetical protein
LGQKPGGVVNNSPDFSQSVWLPSTCGEFCVVNYSFAGVNRVDRSAHDFFPSSKRETARQNRGGASGWVIGTAFAARAYSVALKIHCNPRRKAGKNFGGNGKIFGNNWAV